MRRFRTLVLLAGLMGLLLGPASGTANAQVPDPAVVAVIAGQTIPPAGSPGPDGTNRTAGASTFSQVQITTLVACETGGTTNVVLANVAQGAGQVVDFWSDDDVTDGFGEISATANAAAFVDTGATEVGTDAHAGPATVRIDIEGGRFHRVAGLVEVDLVIDVAVSRGATAFCSGDDVPVKLVLHLLPNTDANLTSGFFLAGAGASAGSLPNALRTACGAVGPRPVPPGSAVVCAPAYG